MEDRIRNIDQKHNEISLKEFIYDIKKWVKYLLSKWYILLFVSILGGGLGFMYAKYSNPIYSATTTFVLESGEQGGGLGQYAGMAAMVGIDIGGKGSGMFQGDNLLELYKSRKMIEAALLKPSTTDSSKVLLDVYLELDNVKDNWKKKSPDLLNIDFRKENNGSKRIRDSILLEAVKSINKNNLVVGNLDKKSSIVKIDVRSKSEVFSKEFNEAIVDEVNAFYITTKTQKSLSNIEILQHKTDSVRNVMNGSISMAATVVDATPNLNPTRQAQRIIPTQRSQFSAETNKVILSQLIQNLEMSKMALLKEAPLIQKVDEPIYPLQVSRVGKIRSAFLGAFLFGMFAISFLIIRQFLKNLLA
ncbi:lipopolysaccharide biosynthesis protein [Sphingobacterium siyangense]|uniref:lipopolysaccharide biosynthesis protein n=1 Tax=Sphingobacterium siyangense TaxID=459529 RepID=UPI003DA3CB94